MTDPAPRWQFKLSELFIASFLVAAFCAVFTALPQGWFQHEDSPFLPALTLAAWSFTAWFGCLAYQLREGKLSNRWKAAGSLVLWPMLAAASYLAVTVLHSAVLDLFEMTIHVAIGAFFGMMSCWIYRCLNRPR